VSRRHWDLAIDSGIRRFWRNIFPTKIGENLITLRSKK
jgi:hypothetical protein